MRFLIIGLINIGLMLSLNAADYFVDYANGSDDKSGASAQQAWKHAPGDVQATGNAKACVLKAGDRVRFKGGVRYYGSIKPAQSGAAGSPIVYDGNTDGNFGKGPAILDGSHPIAKWQRCAKASDALDNPAWKNIYFADIDYTGGWQTFVLCSEAGNMAIAMSPNPRDPMFQDRVSEFFETPEKLKSNAAVSVYAGPGTWLNKDRPIVNTVKSDNSSAVISPIGDATIHIALNKEHLITEIGIGMVRQHTPVKDVKIIADKKHIQTVQLKAKTDEIQRFKLKQPVKTSDIGFNFASTHGKPKANFTAVRYLQAFNADGVNVLEMKPDQAGGMSFSDPKRFTSDDPKYYDGMTVAVHGGHNFTKHLDVTGYDPATKRLLIQKLNDTVYKTTKYALKNSVRLIDVAGEYALHKQENGKTRVFVLPSSKSPDGISYSQLERAFYIEKQSHIVMQGFQIERYAGKKSSAVDIWHAKDITIQDSEITMCAGVAAVHGVHTDGVHILRNNLHHLPIKTRATRFESCKNGNVIGNTVAKPTGTAVSYVGVKGGRCSQNIVSGFCGMHSNGLTFYVHNKDIVVDRNYVHSGKGNVPLTIQTIVNCKIQNNVFDADGGIGIGIWVSVPFENVTIEHNTIVNADAKSTWKTAIFSNNKGPKNLVIRNNILDGIAGNLPAKFSHNIYTRLLGKQTEANLEEGSQLVKDVNSLIDSNYQTKVGSAAVDAASATDVKEDFAANKRPVGKAADIGAYEVQ